MKPLFFVFLAGIFTINPLFSQVKMGKSWEKSLEYYNNIFGNNDPDFENNETPSEFKDEPVVILCQKVYVGLLKAKGRVKTKWDRGGYSKGVIRKQVKIQEESALKDFSEFYFQKSEVVVIFLIKPNGEKQKIAIENAIKVETRVPKFYKSDFINSKYYKIAIPNLEVGDILDFTIIFRHKKEVNYSTSWTTIISSSYPIVKQWYVFDIMKNNWYFYYKTLNGCPEMKEDLGGGVDDKGNKSKKTRRIVLKDEMRAKRIFENWDYPIITEPTLKINVCQHVFQTEISGEKNILNSILYDENNPPLGKSDFLIKGILRKINSLYENQNWASLETDKLVDEIYYFLRHELLERRKKTFEIPDNTYDLDNYSSMTSSAFVSLFKSALDERSIGNEIIYAVPARYGSVDQAIHAAERVMGVFVKVNEKYYFPPDNYSKPSELPVYLNNAQAIKNSKTEEGIIYEQKTTTLPQTPSGRNLSAVLLEMDLSSDMMTPKSLATLSFHESYRRLYSSLFLFNQDYEKKDKKRFYTLTKDRKNGKKKKKDIEKEEWQQKKKSENEKIQLDRIKSYFGKDFSIDELNEYELISDGRYDDEPLVVKLDFSSKDLIKKAGKNYIFSVGSLIGSQVELDKEEIAERIKDIQFTNAKLITNALKIKIPSGFKVEGLENLIFDIDNKWMAFKSSATFENGVLIVDTHKEYKTAFVPKEEWKSVVEALEAAYHFTEAKVVLKKEESTSNSVGKEK